MRVCAFACVVVCLLTGCGEKDDDTSSAESGDDTSATSGETGEDADLDGDGFTTEDGDCDDADAAIRPGADEVCDGVDNDCDGLVDDEDDSVTDAVPWYTDGDGDGYGGEVAAEGCTQPAETVAEGGDCDDSDPALNPGAAEVCDEIDNDCDELVDDDDVGNGNPVQGQTRWFYDGDGDRFGLDGLYIDSCDPVEDFVEVGGDCDDTDPTVNPGMTEDPDNLVDDNCDGDWDD